MAASPADLFASAIRHHREGRVEDAERIYRALLDQYPDEPDLLHLSGTARLQLGDAARGVELIAAAVARRGDAPTYHLNLARGLRSLGRNDEAESAARRAHALAPDVETAVEIARNRRARDETRGARRAVAIAVAIDPASFPAWEEAGHGTIGAAAFRRAFLSRPLAAGVAHNLASALWSLGRTGEAVIACRAAAIVDPGEAAFLNNLALFTAGAGDTRAATRWARRAARVRPDDANYAFNAATRSTADDPEAANAWRRVVELRPTDHTAWENAAIILARAERWDELEAHVAAMARAAARGDVFWKAPMYIAMHSASDFIAANRSDAAREVFRRFRAAMEARHPPCLPWMDFLIASEIVRAGDEAEGRRLLSALIPQLPFLRHVVDGGTFETICRAGRSSALIREGERLHFETPVDGDGPLVFAACDGVYHRRFSSAFLASLDATATPGTRVHLHVADPDPDAASFNAELRRESPRIRLTVSSERVPEDFDAETRRTYFTCLRLIRAPAVLDLHGRPPFVMYDVDSLATVDPARLIGAMTDAESMLLIHRPESPDRLYNAVSNGLVAARADLRVRSILADAAAFLAHWFDRREAAYFLDQVALIRAVDDEVERNGPLGILRVETAAERLGVPNVFHPFINGKTVPDFDKRLRAAVAELRAGRDPFETARGIGF